MGAPPRPPRQHDGMQLEQPARAAQPSAKSICQDRHRRGSARAGSMTVAQSSDLRNAWTLPNAVLGMEKPRRDCPLCGAFLRRDDESRQAVRRHKNKGSGGPFWGGKVAAPLKNIGQFCGVSAGGHLRYSGAHKPPARLWVCRWGEQKNYLSKSSSQDFFLSLGSDSRVK
jgi:hypothetical protein